ncbi:MAG: ABC transporter substrate-binding protein [Myxococcota bacterium]
MRTFKIGLEWFMNPDHVPLLIGLERGWFRDEGLDVELVEPEAHQDAVAALEAGDLDMAITEPIHLVEDVAKERPVRGFARFLHTNGGVMFLESSGIERPSDMAKARVQYPGAPGPGGLAIVRTMVEADGGRVDQLTPINHGFKHTDALIEGLADVATLAFYNFEVVEARHRGHPAQFFALKDWGVPDFCHLIFIASPDRLQAEADDFRKFLRVVSRGLDVLHQDPKEARRIYFERTKTAIDDPLMNAIFDATVPCFTFDMSMSAAYYDRLGAWMTRHTLAPILPSPSRCWTNELVWD